MSIAEYEKMLDAQNGVCALCGGGAGENRRMYVDHNHDTGEIRALLCIECNRGLGAFKDNADVLRRAAEYLDVKGAAVKKCGLTEAPADNVKFVVI